MVLQHAVTYHKTPAGFWQGRLLVGESEHVRLKTKKQELAHWVIHKEQPLVYISNSGFDSFTADSLAILQWLPILDADFFDYIDDVCLLEPESGAGIHLELLRKPERYNVTYFEYPGFLSQV